MVPYLKHGLPEIYADGASEDAARGFDLVAPEGCDNAANGKLWIAGEKRAQKSVIKSVCASVARKVEQAVSRRRDHLAMLNNGAERTWRGFDRIREAELPPTQRARIAAIFEHRPEAGHH